MDKRVPKFYSAKKLQALIDDFFKSCEGEIRLDSDGQPCIDKSGNFITDNQKPPTVSALAYTLGFCSRCDLLKYSGKSSYKDVIERALLRIEMYTEARLFDKYSSAGAKFSLINNFKDWNDKDDDPSFEALVKLDSILNQLIINV